MPEAGFFFTLLAANQTTTDRNMNVHFQENLSSLNKHTYCFFQSQEIGQTLRSEILLKCNDLYISQQFCNFGEKPAASTCTLSTFFRLRQQNFQCVNKYILHCITYSKNVIFGLKAVRQENWHRDSKFGLLNLKQQKKVYC
jgi:hypothetical protein